MLVKGVTNNYLKHYKINDNWTLGNEIQWNLNQNTDTFLQKNVFEIFLARYQRDMISTHYKNKLTSQLTFTTQVRIEGEKKEMVIRYVLKLLFQLMQGLEFI